MLSLQMKKAMLSLQMKKAMLSLQMISEPQQIFT
jgi:hypothetical protein